ncbi:MAG: hypothetical protein K0S43_1138 [Cellulosimicrobium sp.]|jgi:hypothetical protein|nr:hypothetical protein [Cellulosimicrobium sp.]
MSSTVASDVLDAELSAHADAPASGTATGPSNQEILRAAKSAYQAHERAVDALTTALVADVTDTGLTNARNALDATDWSAPGATPALVAPFLDGTAVTSALDAIGADPSCRAVSVGVFVKDGPGDGPGVPGFVAPLPLSAARSGLVVELDIFRHIVSVTPGQNLQYGVWLDGAPDQDAVVGLYLNTTLGSTSVNLKILLASDLQAVGFVSSTGASVPLSTGVFAGSVHPRTF